MPIRQDRDPGEHHSRLPGPDLIRARRHAARARRAALGYFAAALQPAGARDRRPRLRCLVVFVDETFQGFFDLNERGYFCYGVAGIPETHYEAVTAEFASILDPYRKLLVPELNELKHTEFKRIPFPDRWKLACRMHDILLAHGCWDCPNDC